MNFLTRVFCVQVTFFNAPSSQVNHLVYLGHAFAVFFTVLSAWLDLWTPTTLCPVLKFTHDIRPRSVLTSDLEKYMAPSQHFVQ